MMGLLKRKITDGFRGISLPKTIDIAIDKLVIDGAYQRDLNASHINDIRSHFDPDLFQTITVSEREGIFYVIDGMHRLMAVKGRVDKVPCSVWTGLTQQQEAGKFHKLNSNRRALNASVKFQSMVCEGNPLAIHTVNIMSKYGYKYNRYNMMTGENIIGSPSRMMQILERDGERVLCRILNINRKAWHGEKSSLRVQMLVALKTLVVDYPDLDDEHLIKVLSNVSPQAVTQLAAVYVTAQNIGVVQGGGAKYVHIANAMREIYNNGISKKTPEKLLR